MNIVQACSMMCAWRSSKNENFRRKYKTACQRVRKKPKYQEMPTEKAIHADTEDNNCVQINWWLCYVCETMSHCLCGAYTYAYRGLCGHILFINNLASFSSVVVASLLFFSLCDGIRFVANCFLKTINFHMFMFLTRTQPICFFMFVSFFQRFFSTSPSLVSSVKPLFSHELLPCILVRLLFVFLFTYNASFDCSVCCFL